MTYTAVLDGEKNRSLRSFYPRIAEALAFPEYFGRNLDALFDCLCDLSPLAAGGVTEVELQVLNAAHFLEREKPERRDAVLQVLTDATVAENRYDGLVFRFELLTAG